MFPTNIIRHFILSNIQLQFIHTLYSKIDCVVCRHRQQQSLFMFIYYDIIIVYCVMLDIRWVSIYIRYTLHTSLVNNRSISFLVIYIHYIHLEINVKLTEMDNNWVISCNTVKILCENINLCHRERI